MRRKRAAEILERVRGLKVLVVGDLILDRYLYGRVERISPEAPVPVVEVEKEEVRLGGAGNVASNLASLGAKTYIAGVVGEDRGGDLILSLLKERGIEPLLVTDRRPTTEKTRVVSRSQQLLRIDREERKRIQGKTLKKIREIVAEVECDGVVVSDYAKGVITEDVMRAVKEKGVFFAVDPRPVNRDLYKGADLMTPNEKELREMTDPLSGEEVETLGIRLRERLLLDTLVVTRGPKGMTLFREGVRHFPARARKVYDVTGAGDTVVASLLAFHLAGAGWDEACELANVCAGIVVGEFGTATVKPEEVLREIEEG
ncbi:MAG: D-glycero-beta-D-manno-heptose-7-phosphate kinase [Aquificota bacterium]|nr:D-glycero-beta-D-manno-heptose-7-phosphate kinase [Aquificota bacterium]